VKSEASRLARAVKVSIRLLRDDDASGSIEVVVQVGNGAEAKRMPDPPLFQLVATTRRR
jgi:hypothetical protein